MKRLLLMGMFLTFLFGSLLAQERTISGTITSGSDKSALPGVSVVAKGTSVGTATDVDGKYKISVPANATKLVVSFVGFLSQEIEIGNRNTVDVVLEEDVRQLTEVVVTGVGSATDKRKLGISVESVTADKLPAIPTASVDQALIGKIAGAQISSTDGTPGANINILLRGINTINRGTSPMILLDGVQVAATNLNSLDLNAIERIEVVQGAAAATIYGAQGANGVIQLFSKKGKSGQINIDISSSVTQNTYLNVGGLKKAEFHGFDTNASGDVIGGSGRPIEFDPATNTFSENLIWRSTDPNTQINKPYNRNLLYYNHFDQLFQSANTFNNSVVISGGKDKFNFAISASNNRQESNIRNNGFLDRSNFMANIGMELFKGFTFRSTTQLVYTKNTINYNQGILYPLFNTRPFANYTAKDNDGNYGYYFGDASGVNGSNPYYLQQYSSSLDNKIDVVQSFNANYKPNKYLDLDASYGLNYQRQEQIYRYENQTKNASYNYWEGGIYTGFYAPDGTGEVDNYSYNTTFQNFITKATLSTDFKEDFGWNLPIRTVTQVGFDYRNTKFTDYRTYGLGLPDYTPYNSSQAGTFRIVRDYREPFVTYGYLVNQRIEWGDVAGVSGGFRTDFSSAFGRGSSPFTFPRADGYVRISAFDFWQNGKAANIVSEWKVRAAYGEAGIQPRPFDRYVTLNTRTIGNTNVFFLPTAQSNPDLSVEVSRELEIGTDLTFNIMKQGDWLRNINFSGTYWKRSTDNAIWDVNAAPSTGIGSIKDNAFSLGSNGLQFSLNANIVTKKDFSWNFVTNFGRQTSQITAVKGPEIVITSAAGSTNYVLKEGQKIGQLFGFVLLKSVDERDPNGNPYIPADQQGNYEVASNGAVVDKNTKAPFFTPSQYSFGDPNPLFNMSFINDFTYKNFLTFSFQIDWVQGAHLYNQTKEWMYRDGIHSDYQNPFTINGQTGAWSAFYRGIYAERSRNGTKDYFYENSSFARLRNLAIGVDFAKLFEMKAFKRLQLVLSGRNLMTWTKYSGMDPEVSSGTNNSAWDRGTDHNTMPNYKSYQVTLNVGF